MRKPPPLAGAFVVADNCGNRSAPVGTVRAAAMVYFEVSEDPALRFYLVHDGAEVADTTTLGDVARRAKAVKFTLAKEIVNG